MIDYRYDTQLLIEGNNLNEDEINDYIYEQNYGYDKDYDDLDIDI